MSKRLWEYRVAGMVGGLMLAAGQFWGPACLMQAFALMPALWLISKEPLAKPSETRQDSPVADLSDSFTICALT